MANDQNIGSLMSAGYLSYLNDDPGKEWERDLLTAPAGANLYGLQQARETLALLWNTGDLTAVSGLNAASGLTSVSGLTTLSGLTSVSGLASVSDLTAAPEQTAAAALPADIAGSSASEDSQPFSAYSGTRPASSRPGQNSAPPPHGRQRVHRFRRPQVQHLRLHPHRSRSRFDLSLSQQSRLRVNLPFRHSIPHDSRRQTRKERCHFVEGHRSFDHHVCPGHYCIFSSDQKIVCKQSGPRLQEFPVAGYRGSPVSRTIRAI